MAKWAFFVEVKGMAVERESWDWSWGVKAYSIHTIRKRMVFQLELRLLRCSQHPSP